MSSANSFAFDKTPARSFMYFRNRRGPNVEPWGNHALMSANEEVCSCYFLLSIYQKITYQV